MNYFDTSSLLEPRHFSAPAPWSGHIPFGSWLIAVHQPAIFVELGAYSGISYLSFCQAIQELQLPTKAFAVDTWQGDAHAGIYDESVYRTLISAHEPYYTGFSTLLRMAFDDALSRFADKSIDLLHIDGLHTYEAVRHDFESWLPKMSSRGVMLFHDTQVFRDDFGVHRLWAELSERYPSIEFMHSNGLGVLLVGVDQVDGLLQLCSPEEHPGARKAFSILGARLERHAEVLILETKLRDIHEQVAILDSTGQQRHQWIEHLDGRIRELEQCNRLIQSTLDNVNHQLKDRELSAQRLTRDLFTTRQQLAASNELVQEIYQSRSWRITKGLRTGGDLVRRSGVNTFFRRIRSAARYALRGQWGVIVERMTSIRRETALTQQLRNVSARVERIGVMATPHTMFVAHQFVRALQKAGFTVQVMTDAVPGLFTLDLYIVICPQMFKRLPPGEKRIVFQMEQSVSSRWFTDEYLRTLENSLAVLDYAQANLQFLAERGITYPHTYLLPVGGVTDYVHYLSANNLQPVGLDVPCDVIFYGDANAPRRQKLLDAIGKQYNLRIIGNLFGSELYRALASAKVVVNLHYYEGALLETTRIYECLSLGLPVVSEMSSDQSEYAALEQAIRFVPVGDEIALLQAIDEVLKQAKEPESMAVTQAACQAVVADSQANFEFMLYRMLLAHRIVDYSRFEFLTSHILLPSSCLALSLPETTIRRAMFTSHQMPGVQLFNGIRYSPGWIGCALSYKYLARQALAARMPKLEVMEDDVLFPPGYTQHKAIVQDYLARHEGNWDVFAGLIAIIHPDTQILSVDREDGLVFVTIDRMMSMVHNIYAPSILQLLAEWDETNTDPETNTIDRHLQNSGHLRIVTTLPFMVGHHEELHSSLWGFQNTQYSEIISNAQLQLEIKVREFEDVHYAQIPPTKPLA